MELNLLQQLGPKIKVANTLIEKELNNQIAQLIPDYNLTGPQITLLVYLYESKGRTITQREVAQKFALSHPTMRSIVKRLVQADLINTGHLANDRRQVSLSLTNKGVALLDQHIDAIRTTMAQVNRRIIAGLTAEQQQQLAVTLTQIIQNF